jgi:hypothetical protein
MRSILYSLIFALSPLYAETASAPSSSMLKAKFQQAREGDFIVTAQETNYSLLFIRHIDAHTLILEEVTVPEAHIDPKKIHWQKWLSDKAPGHTAWTLYEIDPMTGALIETFSYSQNGWLFLNESQLLLSKLLTLPLRQLPLEERRKIGPQPQAEEVDRRAVWNPPLILSGKKIPKPQFEVWKTRWPEDSSLLSGCSFELYFSKHDPSFAFPRWIEVQSPHYTFKLRTVDSGTGLQSPFAGPMPHRPPQFKSPIKKSKEEIVLTLDAAPYHNSFTLYAIDLTEHKPPIPVAHTITRGNNSSQVCLHISTRELSSLLTPTHRYKWTVIPEEDRRLYAESDELFIPTLAQ